MSTIGNTPTPVFVDVEVRGQSLRLEKTEKNAAILSDGKIDDTELATIADLKGNDEVASQEEFKAAGFSVVNSQALSKMMEVDYSGMMLPESTLDNPAMDALTVKGKSKPGAAITDKSLAKYLGVDHLKASDLPALETKMKADGVPETVSKRIMQEAHQALGSDKKDLSERTFKVGEKVTTTEVQGTKLVQKGTKQEQIGFAETYEAFAKDNGTTDWSKRYAVNTSTPAGQKTLTSYLNADFNKIIAKFKDNPAGFEAALEKGFPGAFQPGDGARLLKLCQTGKSQADIKEIQALLYKIPLCATFMDSNGGLDAKYGVETTRAVRALNAFLGDPQFRDVPNMVEVPNEVSKTVQPKQVVTQEFCITLTKIPPTGHMPGPHYSSGAKPGGSGGPPIKCSFD